MKAKRRPDDRYLSIIRAWSLPIAAASSEAEHWDQVAKFGEFKKNGADATFSRETLGQIVANFAAQKNPIPGDVEHQALHATDNGQPAPLAATYDALALIQGGKVVAQHSQGDPVDVQGQGLSDGLWARREKLTPFGKDLLENKGYGFISPTFWTDGENEQGESIGYVLLTASWTVIPFLDGMAPVTYSRLSFGQAPTATPKEPSMDKKALYARYGLAENCTDDEKDQAMQKFADASDAAKKEVVDDSLEKMADQPDDAKKKEQDEELAEMRKLAGVGPSAGLRDIRLAISATKVEPSEYAALRREVTELKAAEAERAKASIQERASQLAAFAVSSGRIADEEKRRTPIVKMALSNFEAAKEFVDSLPVVHPTRDTVTSTIAKGVDRSAPTISGRPEDAQVVGLAFSAAVRERVAKTGEKYAIAMHAVAAERPDLWAARNS